ncbi:hypothetical protein H7Y40_00040 [Pedobacter sp.]|nr:hypothetical protein [Candidatus Saccharibacteria bacterium]
MFQLDDNFLNDLGLGVLPEDQKQAFLQHIYEQLELSVGTKLSEGLSEAQMQEFEAFVDQDEEKVRLWLSVHLPQYAQSDDFKKLEANAPANTPEISLLSEYGSLKWLEVNRPDYRQVVAAELELIKKDIVANRDSILGTTTV